MVSKMMKYMSAAALFILCIPAVISVKRLQHTTCYNYFLHKDGCVFASPLPRDRCKAPPKDYTDPVKLFAYPSGHEKRDTSSQLQRRYDANDANFPIASGTGICGRYDSTKELAVCLWSGAEQKNPTPQTAGWLNGALAKNCGKRVYIQRKGRPDTVQYARVIDGCYFNDVTPAAGCFQIGLSLQLFEKFKPNAKEKHDQKLYGGITWDFDNLTGNNPAEGPI